MKKSALFPQVEPPPHGLARLRAQIKRPRRAVGWWAVAAVAALVLVVLGLRPSDSVDLMPDVRAAATAAGLGLEAPISEPVLLASSGAALVRLHSGNPQVVLYRVAVLGQSDALRGADQKPGF